MAINKDLVLVSKFHMVQTFNSCGQIHYWKFPKCRTIVQVLSPWTTLMSMDGLPLMDDLLEWLALGFWTTPMDELEMVLFFGTPSVAPLSKGRPECY